MAKRRFQYEVATGKLTLPVTILLSTVLWIVFSFFKPIPTLNSSYPFWQMLLEWVPGNVSGNIFCFLCYGVIAYLLIEFNNAYSIIRMRTSLQTSVYLLMILAFPFLHRLNIGCLVSLCTIISLYLLFRCYQKQQPVGYFFHSMLFMGIASLLFPKILLLVPVFLIGIYNFKALTMRTFFAGMMGLTLPYWFLFGHAFYHGKMDLFYIPFKELVCFQPLFSLNLGISFYISAGFTFFLLLVSSIHYWITSYEDKIRIRAYLNFLIIFSFSTIIFGVLQVQYVEILLQVLLPVVALLMGHLFALSHTKVSNLFFIFSILLLVIIMCYNLWTL